MRRAAENRDSANVSAKRCLDVAQIQFDIPLKKPL
jgi:hypothetical protein